jgi:class 3 adenylate cyclase
MSYHIGILVQELVGAAILAMFYFWLRRRQVKDPSLLWLCFSLLSWAAAAFATLVFGNNQEINPLIKYIFSPVSSILVSLTAFRLSRVREAIRDHGLEMWPKLVVGAVCVLSGVALLLMWRGGGIKQKTISTVSLLGMSIDAVASTLALVALGAGLVYSFYKYGNHLLIVLTTVDLTYIMWRQFDAISRLSHGDPSSGGEIRSALNIASYTTLTMIFIALAVAWSLSDASRLKRVGTPSHVTIIVVFLDLRGATQWARNKDVKYMGTFIDALGHWALTHFLVPPLSRPNLIKFLGDGFLFIWEIADDSMIMNRCNLVASVAYSMHQNYSPWVKDTESMWMGAPCAIGIGVDHGLALRLTFENGSIDYVGAPLNNAAKMQDLARPDGGVVIGDNPKLSEDVREKYPVVGHLVIGNESIPVRATRGVKLQPRGKIRIVR